MKEEVDKITIEKVELEEKTSFLEKVFGDDNDDILRVFGSNEQCFSVINSYCGITPISPSYLVHMYVMVHLFF